MRASGKIKSDYPALIRNGNLAELVGVVLGDGHIWKYPRTEELSIFSNSNNLGFIERYSGLVEKVFGKKPVNTIHSKKNCIRIRIYEKHIGERLGVPISPRRDKNIKIPRWILDNNQYIVRYLRGLYEAEGAYCRHAATSTWKLFFSNKNESMLKNVFMLIQKLGFHPHISKNNYKVQLSKKEEVLKAVEMLEFRKY